MDLAIRKMVNRLAARLGGRKPTFAPNAALDSTLRVYPAQTGAAGPADTGGLEERVLAGLVLEGYCPVCGSASRFEGFSENFRESGVCSRCRSMNRNRQLASLMRRQFALPETGELRFSANFSIFSAEASGPLHEQLKRHAGYVCSEYWGPAHRSGEIIRGIRHEDLQALSFEDQSLDLVLSSDVLEHMPHPYRAHAEILRVLKPGGRHLFTVPFVRGWSSDEVRAQIVDGDVIYLKEKIYHGDPIRPLEGVLVWTIFGMEMLGKLEELGFEVTMWLMYEPSHGIIGQENTIFEAKRIQ